MQHAEDMSNITLGQRWYCSIISIFFVISHAKSDSIV